MEEVSDILERLESDMEKLSGDENATKAYMTALDTIQELIKEDYDPHSIRTALATYCLRKSGS